MARSTTFLRTLLTATFLIAAGAGCSKNIDQGPAANPDTNSGPDAGRSGAQRMYAASAMAADATQPDLARGKLLATQVCGQCHGADGNSPTAAFPRLASQHQEYLVKQLNDFKVPRGDRVSARNNPIMAGITASLSEQDARNVAAYLALQPAKPGVAPNAADVTLGEKIYRMGIADRGIPACTSCHGPLGREWRRNTRACRASGRIM